MDLTSFGGLTSPPRGGGVAAFPRRTSGLIAAVPTAGVAVFTVLAVTVAPDSSVRCATRFATGAGWRLFSTGAALGAAGRAFSTAEAFPVAGEALAARWALPGEFAPG